MKQSFFSTLISMLFGMGKRPVGIRELVKSPRLQRVARNVGNKRRLARHRQSCEDGYRAKIALVREGVGSHTLAGIPAVHVPDDMKARA